MHITKLAIEHKAIITTGALMIVIYGGYFMITYICNKNIIKEIKSGNLVCE